MIRMRPNPNLPPGVLGVYRAGYAQVKPTSLLLTYETMLHECLHHIEKLSKVSYSEQDISSTANSAAMEDYNIFMRKLLEKEIL